MHATGLGGKRAVVRAGAARAAQLPIRSGCPVHAARIALLRVSPPLAVSVRHVVEVLRLAATLRPRAPLRVL